MSRPNVSEQRKREIIQAAAQVFTALGLSNARMEDVANAAGISKGTIYLYFTSKEKIIEALLQQLFTPLDAALESLIVDTAPTHARLLDYGRVVLDSFEMFRAFHPLILELFALAPRQAFAGALFGAYFVQYRDALTAILQAAGDEGSLSLTPFEGDARRAAVSFMAMLEGVLLLALINPGLIDLRQDGLNTLTAWLKQI